MKNILLLCLFIAFTSLTFSQNKNSSGSFELMKNSSHAKWIGKKLRSEHTGNISIKDAQLTIQGDHLTGIAVSMDMNSITCEDLKDPEYNAKLVDHLKSEDFFDTKNFPTASFKSNSVTPGDKVKSGGSHFIVSGDLTIKGSTHPVSFPADIYFRDGKMAATAIMTFDRTKYGIKYGSGSFFEGLGDKLISDEVSIPITLVGSSTSTRK